jgi:hypothetical protein|tara:strand:- start:1449 stop:1643 length:195 start_codon:yes stop_codon:yes gene_type:complete
VNVGDLVMFCDGSSDVSPVVLIRLVPDSLPGGSGDGAVVMNETGTYWVRISDLVPIDEDIMEAS